MRYVDHPRSGLAAPPRGRNLPGLRSAGRALLVCAALTSLPGCSTVSLPIEATPTTTPASTEAKPAAPVLAPVPADVQAQFERALQAQRSGRTDEAQRLWAALAQAHPELGGVHANMGLMQRQAGRHAEAVASLERAVQASPTQARFHNELGIAYRANGQFGQAREAYKRAIALDANYAAALLNLGILHDLYLGERANALALYERYLALAPGGDAAVSKWAADLRLRKPAALTAAATQVAKSGKEVP